jgi:hypothetical protein
MSVVRLLLSGVLVAGGLLLGTFTLHGYLDPNWTQSQLAASAAGSKPPAVVQSNPKPFPSRSRFVASDVAAASQPHVVKASSRPAATPAAVQRPESRSAASKPATKPAVRKNIAAKRKPPPAPPAQQASLQFPWNWKLFGN